MKLSPVTRRRLDNFYSNKRGFIALILFIILFMISMSANILANDKPIFIWFKNHAYMPVFKAYSEIDFGGDF